MKTWTVRLWCSNVIKKEASKKSEVELKSDFMPINWTDANTSEQHSVTRSRETATERERERDLQPWLTSNSALQGKQI